MLEISGIYHIKSIFPKIKFSFIIERVKQKRNIKKFSTFGNYSRSLKKLNKRRTVSTNVVNK